MKFLTLVLLTFSASNLTFGQFDFDGKPGLKPKLFAAGIVSSENDSEFGITFDRNGNAAYFTRREKGKSQKIYVTDFVGGKWSAPRIAPFSTDCDEAPFISPDNRTLYFGSTRPVPNRVSKGNFDMNIWQVSRTADGWSAPVPLSEKINKVQIEKEEFPSSNESGINSPDGENFYFSTQRRGARGIDIYKTTLRNGEFAEPEKVAGEVNSEPPGVAAPAENAEFGALSGVTVTAANPVPAPLNVEVQPVGRAGAVTPSKFCESVTTG